MKMPLMPSIASERRTPEQAMHLNPQQVFPHRLSPNYLSVRSALSALADWASIHLADADLAERIELVLAEALNNVVEHGGLAPQQFIAVFAQTEASGLRVVIRDQGQKYPSSMPPWVTVQNVTDLPEGGFGWLLIHALSDEVVYERIGPGNILTILFSVANNPETHPIVPVNCLKNSMNRPQ